MPVAELITNSATPGQATPLCSLLEAMPASAPGAVEAYAVSAPAPFTLRGSSAQFRVAIDDEYLIVAASADGASPWTFTRGAEDSPPQSHRAGSSVFYTLTTGAILALIAAGGGGGGGGGPTTTLSIDGGLPFSVATSFIDGGLPSSTPTVAIDGGTP